MATVYSTFAGWPQLEVDELGVMGLGRPSVYVATTTEAYERRDVSERSDISPDVEVRMRVGVSARVRARVCGTVGLCLSLGLDWTRPQVGRGGEERRGVAASHRRESPHRAW